MVTLSNEDFDEIVEAIKGALTEIELCEDISQGVEDDLVCALSILKEAKASSE